MTDKQFDKQKDRVKKLVTRYKPLLGLGSWRVKITFEREHVQMDKDGHNVSTVMSINPLWEYKDALLTVFCLETERLNEEELAVTVLHELCHALVAPLSQKRKYKEEEFVVTELALAFYNIEKNALRRRKRI